MAMDMKTVKKVEVSEGASEGGGTVVVGGDIGVSVPEGRGAVVVGGNIGAVVVGGNIGAVVSEGGGAGL